MPERMADGQIISFEAQEMEQINRLQETWCAAGALALSEMLGREVRVNPIRAVMQSVHALNIPQPVCQTVFILSLSPGQRLMLIFQNQDALVLADLILGGDGSTVQEPGSELHTGAAAEAMRTLVGGIANSLSNHLGDRVEVLAIDTEFGDLRLPVSLQGAPAVIQIPLSLSVVGLIDADAWMLVPPEFFISFLSSGASSGQEADRKDTDAMSVLGSLPQSDPQTTQPLEFPPIDAGISRSVSSVPGAYPAGLNLLLDIPLEVSVELGRVKMLIKDILDLGTGSVVELDKVAGEPVDLLVNGKLVAKGEVVVIEDNFGIRVTEILSPMERLSGLRGE